MKNPLGYLLLGVVFWLPVGVAVLVVSLTVGSLEPIGKSALEFLFPDHYVHAGMGITFWIVIMFLTGLLLKTTRIGRLASALPIVGFLFLRLDEHTMTLDRLMHLTPCLFLYSPTCLSYGWILSEQDVSLGEAKSPISLMNVYYPNVPTLVTGQVYSARKETIMKLGNPSREVVDILLYGLRRPDQLRYLPWDDESEMEFKQRAQRFGITEEFPSTPPT